MISDFEKYFLEHTNILKATIHYARRPSDEELEALKKKLADSYGASDVLLEEHEDVTLINGYVLKIGDSVFDNSVKSSISKLREKMKSANTDDVISMMKSEVSGFERKLDETEGGFVSFVGDGIVSVDGISHAEYGEIVLLENGMRAMVQSILPESVECILFGTDDDITEGTKVMRTHKRAGIPVGDALLGRVVDPLGQPIDGKGDIKSDAYFAVEREAPSVIDRKAVTVPLQTGILAIDSMFPIGRGQRELIIGDRQTGKTSVALDTIINQRGKDVICVYVAIGQKASSIANIVRTLEKHGASDYTVVLSATASDPASLQYIAPYSGCAIAEYFMEAGRDVLIVYDDLSKHAVAYRSLSLLLQRPPGREAYPGDVFYIQSRLLERACRLNDENGGGSITALPIIETQASDVSAYIPTNVISITDGQIFLETELFFAGIRPAVNVGLSVSRVGGAAQTKAMKKAAGTLRIDLAQFNEMRSFTQFSSDIDEDTRHQLEHGKVLTELLKQPLYHPKSVLEMVLTLVLAGKHIYEGIPYDKLCAFTLGFMDYAVKNESEICKKISEEGLLTDADIENIAKLAEKYKAESF